MSESPPLTDPRLPPGAELLSRGRALARDWRVGPCPFFAEKAVTSEAEWKRRIGNSRIMQHAHIGFRNVDRTLGAIAEVHDRCAAQSVTVDRFGITLDWSMGYPQALREKAARGTGIVLTGPEDFARITHAAPAAAHFGDFMIGLPGCVENTCAALAAGATSVGNLGQYFTFRLPYWNDDVATTEATVTALGLIAAQETQVLVHSNLDDGFAGLFLDMASALGMVLVEKHIVEGLIGARLAHCYGHHFSDPLSRMAFHAALARVTDPPGTMIFGNTVAYQAGSAGNYASLASYLLADMMALGRWATGHAVNPVPVTENQRIPDVDEIVEAQAFARRLADHAPHHAALTDWHRVEALADRLVAGGRAFAQAVLAGLADRGVPEDDPAALLLAIRRMGPKRLEALFGQGPLAARGRAPLVAAEWARELDEKAERWVAGQTALPRRLRVCVGTSDVHEHGKYLVEQALEGMGVEVLDGGVSTDPEALVAQALAEGAEALAISTYNGVALGYAQAVMAALNQSGATLPVLIGGKLNQIPDASNTGLPVDVTAEIAALGATPCAGLDDMLPALRKLL
ncbi:B12 binding protein [Gemmobacter caeni]|uniref:B12 binding protein n=1 Tax=Gemmobacter caeni TaxID=589035 RepID=A0A2T6B0F2_9RHOB|nr:cobalamin-dependent protein [Gemmobacter caeni]PTX49537.1 B12 binding protein [Gemmobacter caeni]TWJ00416.1 B12 binding protein [Gemmobacter caeni]